MGDKIALSTTEKPTTASCQLASRTKNKTKRTFKRFIWHDDLHLSFVAAIFDLGLKNASPKTLLALMEASGLESNLTTEHVKSHLQKYRLHYKRSRRELKTLRGREIKHKKRRQRHGNSAIADPTLNAEPVDGIAAPAIEQGDQRSRTSFCSPRAPNRGSCVGHHPVQTALTGADMLESWDPQWRALAMPMSNSEADELSIQIPQQAPHPHPIEEQTQEAFQLHAQMNQLMQARMDCHRQMLTRKVELLYPSLPMDHRMKVTSVDLSSQQASGGDSDRVWAGSQALQHQRPPWHYHNRQGPTHQLSETSALVDGLPMLPSLIANDIEGSTEMVSHSVDAQSHEWDPLNVNLDQDDLFDFLK